MHHGADIHGRGNVFLEPWFTCDGRPPAYSFSFEGKFEKRVTDHNLPLLKIYRDMSMNNIVGPIPE